MHRLVSNDDPRKKHLKNPRKEVGKNLVKALKSGDDLTKPKKAQELLGNARKQVNPQTTCTVYVGHDS